MRHSDYGVRHESIPLVTGNDAFDARSGSTAKKEPGGCDVTENLLGVAGRTTRAPGSFSLTE
jgi:hypothetical protein